jgi:hypothetical protein
LLPYRAKVSAGVHGSVSGFFSIHLSGIVNGFTHVMAFAGDASAIATARTPAVSIPKYFAMSKETGLPRDASR